jgi:hypothetical protein
MFEVCNGSRRLLSGPGSACIVVGVDLRKLSLMENALLWRDEIRAEESGRE